MKKIIPFKKELAFETNLYEIVSISLEHTLKEENNIIKGNFIITGEYRITDTSANTVPFNFDVPFTVAIDEMYDISEALIDINDFYYEIIDSKSLVVNIELKLDNVKEALLVREDVLDVCDNDTIEEENEIREETGIKDMLFNNFDDNDTYVNYKVYIVREGDNVENIALKYNVDIALLKDYNDLTSIKIGDKIVIPYVKNK